MFSKVLGHLVLGEDSAVRKASVVLVVELVRASHCRGGERLVSWGGGGDDVMRVCPRDWASLLLMDFDRW